MRPLVLPVLVALAFLAAGCGGSGGAGGPEPASFLLLSTEARYAGSRAEIAQSFGMSLSHLDYAAGDIFDEIFDDGAPWTAADIGRVRTVERGDGPDEAMFAEQASNGIDEGLYYRWYFNGNESGGQANDESARWAGGFDGTLDPDAAGYVVTRVEIELVRADLDSPAHDPNGDGNYTVYDIRWAVRVYGYEAP